MKKVLPRRPSASMVVALLALVVAMSGTAVAASLVSGDKLIRKHSLSGNRLRNHTITGAQVNVSTLGKVPSAKNADHATTASSATNAINATNATNAANASGAATALVAANANNLGGQPASAYLPASALQRTGVITVSPGTTGKPVTSTGPFSVTIDCTVSGGVTTATINAGSTVGNWLDSFSGKIVPAAGSGPISSVDDSSSKGSAETNSAFVEMTAPSGTQLDGQWTYGVNWPTSGQCFYTGYVIA